MAAMQFNAIAARAPYDPSRIAVGILDVVDVPLIQWFENDAKIHASPAHLLTVDPERWRYLWQEDRSKLVYLVHQSIYFVLNAGYIQGGLLENMANCPLPLRSSDAYHDEVYPPRKIGMELPKLRGNAVFLVGKVIDGGGPNEAIAHLYAAEFVGFK